MNNIQDQSPLLVQFHRAKEKKMMNST